MNDAKTILITGASSGIGFAASRQLAANGAALVMVSRDPVRGAVSRDQVARVAAGPKPIFVAADLSSQQAIRTLAAELHARFTSLDVLINNAGTQLRHRELSADGLEKTFATNHLAPFLLTQLLLDLLLAAPAGRVITTTSEIHGSRLEFDNLQGERHYNFFSPTPARSLQTSSSPTSWPGDWRAPASPRTALPRGLPEPTLAGERVA